MHTKRIPVFYTDESGNSFSDEVGIIVQALKTGEYAIYAYMGPNYILAPTHTDEKSLIPMLYKTEVAARKAGEERLRDSACFKDINMQLKKMGYTA